MKLTKTKEIYFTFINDWVQFIHAHRYNWSDFNFALVKFSFEDDRKMTGGIEITFILLGIGLRIRYAWNFSASKLGQAIDDFVEAEFDLRTCREQLKAKKDVVDSNITSGEFLPLEGSGTGYNIKTK